MLKKVLVVDDSELIHTMYGLILKRYPGCTQIKAMNGKEALDMLAIEDGIDLILLDINMPVMNGFQFLKTIRKEGKFSHIPVIIITVEDKEEDKLRGLNLGAKGYIAKPFKSSVLHKLIDSILNKELAANGSKGK